MSDTVKSIINRASSAIVAIASLTFLSLVVMGALPPPQSINTVSQGAGIDAAERGIAVNKSGIAFNMDSDVPTDVWDGADIATNQPIWIAPTAPRIHSIVSTSTDDADGGLGARTIRVFGLPDWDTREVIETITMDGTTPVNTESTFVVIYRMRTTTTGPNGPNVGEISATAAVDGTLTAKMLADTGTTQMALYGMPEGQSLYVTHYYAGFLRGSGSANALANALVWITPDVKNQPNVWLLAHASAVSVNGQTTLEFQFDPFARIDGPVLFKIQMTAGVNNAQGYAGFDGIRLSRPIAPPAELP